MEKEALKRHLAAMLERKGYVVFDAAPPFDLEATGDCERLLIDVRGEMDSEGALWSSFVGVVAHVSLLAEKEKEEHRGCTLCIAFSRDYKRHLKSYLHRIDRRVEILLVREPGEIERLRNSWVPVPEDEASTGSLAHANTVVAKVPTPPETSEPAHPDGVFSVDDITYEVRGGCVAWAKQAGMLLYPVSFEDLCDRLGLSAGPESAPRVLHRTVQAAESQSGPRRDSGHARVPAA